MESTFMAIFHSIVFTGNTSMAVFVLYSPILSLAVLAVLNEKMPGGVPGFKGDYAEGARWVETHASR